MLRIVDVIVELIRECAPIAEAIGRKDADLASQFRRALTSAALNTAEASPQRGARKANHYAIALGSAEEAAAALRTAEAWGYVAPISRALADKFERVLRTLQSLASR